MFLFYANLLMGEFTRTNGRGKTLLFAIHDVFTLENFTIGLVCAGIGYIVFEFWRRKLAYLPELRPKVIPAGTAEDSSLSERGKRLGEIPGRAAAGEPEIEPQARQESASGRR